MNLNFEQLILDQQSQKSQGRVAFAARFFVFYAGVQIADEAVSGPMRRQFTATMAVAYGAQVHMDFSWGAFNRCVQILLPHLGTANNDVNLVKFIGDLSVMARLLSVNELFEMVDTLRNYYDRSY